MSPTLEEATTIEIIDELGKRYEGVLLGVISKSRQGEGEGVELFYRNGFVQAVGISTRIHEIMKTYRGS